MHINPHVRGNKADFMRSITMCLLVFFLPDESLFLCINTINCLSTSCANRAVLKVQIRGKSITNYRLSFVKVEEQITGNKPEVTLAWKLAEKFFIPGKPPTNTIEWQRKQHYLGNIGKWFVAWMTVLEIITLFILVKSNNFWEFQTSSTCKASISARI